MLRADPNMRASMPEIFSHVWMRLQSQNAPIQILQDHSKYHNSIITEKVPLFSEVKLAPTETCSTEVISTSRVSVHCTFLIILAINCFYLQ